MIQHAYEEAVKTKQVQIVDRDGFGCLMIYHTGVVRVMVPVNTYRIMDKSECVNTNMVDRIRQLTDENKQLIDTIKRISRSC